MATGHSLYKLYEKKLNHSKYMIVESVGTLNNSNDHNLNKFVIKLKYGNERAR
jgi:hypothetical protein